VSLSRLIGNEFKRNRTAGAEAFRNLTFQPEVVEQRFGAADSGCPHHDQQFSQNLAEHGRIISF
jgi:hypothetical protein